MTRPLPDASDHPRAGGGTHGASPGWSLPGLGLLALALLFPDAVHPSSRLILLAGGGILAAASLLALGAGELRALATGAACLLPFVLLVHFHASQRQADLQVLRMGILYAGVFLCFRPRVTGDDGAARIRDACRLALRPIATTMAVLATALAIHGIWQVFVSLPAALQGLPPGGAGDLVRVRLASGRAFATLLLPSSLATVLAASLPLTVFLLLRAGSTAVRALLSAAALLQLFTLILTQSLTGVVAIAAAGAVALLALPRRARALSLLLLLLVLLGAGSAVALLRGREVLSLTDPGSTFGLRWGNWVAAARMLADHPLVGVGNGGYGIRYPSYMREGMNESRYVHGDPLQLLAENGLWVAVPLALLAASLLRRLRAALRAGDPGAALVAASVAAFLAAFLVDFGLRLPPVAMGFFALLALLYPAPAGDPRPSGRARSLCGAAAALLALACVWLAAAEYAGAGLRDRARAAADRGDLERAAENARLSIRVDPRHPDGHGLLAFLLYQSSGGRRGPALEEASAAAEEAIRLDPWTPLRHEQAAYPALARGDIARGFRGFARAAELFPLRAGYREERDRLLEEIRRHRIPGGQAP